MQHLGNICNINGAEVEPVDVITFGSPCQDMSVAGKREGIKHSEQGDEETTRSGLFYEAVRIIEEMRKATNGEYPKYAVWENVPGAFSSNKGRDFHAVLEALCSVCDDTVSIPEPYDKKRTKLVWNKSGEIVGDNYSVAWRTLDAQYWGVPQRRKRIYLVADFTGRCAGEILFKQESLRGDMSQSNEAGQEVTADAVGGVDGGVGAVGIDGYNFSITGDKAATVGVNCGMSTGRNGVIESVGRNTGFGAGEDGDPAYTLQANHPHAVCFDRATFNQGINAQYDFEVSQEGIVSTVVAKGPSGVCYDARGNGDGETACTITGDHQNRITDYTAVAVFEPKSALEENWDKSNVKNALRAGASKSSHAVVQKTYTMQRSDEYQECNVASTQSARQYKSATDLVVEKKRKYIIRRLTPTECARLQGFPDKWGHLAPYNPADAEFWEDVRKTHAEINSKKYKPVKDIKKWYNKLHTDSAEYKMWGNGIALPNARYVLQGIVEQGAKTLGSLFDGSGGFPLAGVLNGMEPVWASEVEPYCIAVTKSRFNARE